MFCKACSKKIVKIEEDENFDNWKRKYHKKCWKDRNIYYSSYLKMCKIENCNPKTLELYRKLSCME